MLKTICLTPSNLKFTAKEGETVLEAALANNINLDYGCANGRCGRCKATLLEGSILQNKNVYDINLLPNEFLTCQCFPNSNLILKADYHPELDSICRTTLPVKVDGYEYASKDVLIITLRLPSESNFRYLPGQYIELRWGGDKRSYSIANSELRNGRIELHIKKVERGLFSEFLFRSLRVNQLMHVHGPLGTFFLKESEMPVIFMCTGTGFAPVKSIVEYLIEKNSKRKIYIYWGGRTEREIYSDLPYKWAQLHENIHFTPVFSQAHHIGDETEPSYVQNAVVREHADLEGFEVYACGLYRMILSAREILVENGLNYKNFHSDAFLPSN